jgi:DHA1 family inner membrane transport protein
VSGSVTTQHPPSRGTAARSRLRYAGVYLLLFLVGTETFLISPLLPTIAGAVQVSEREAAVSITAYTLAYAITAPFLGVASDRFGRRTAIVAGAVLFVVGNLLAAVAGSLELLIAARVASALGAALAGPSIWAHLSETSSDETRGRAIGTGMALFSCGQVVGVPIGSFLAGAGDWRTPFWALTVLSVLALPLVRAQVRGGRPTAPTTGAAPAEAAPAAPPRTGVLTVWRDPLIRHTLLVVVLLQAANLGAYSFLGAVLHSRFGLGVDELGVLGLLVGVGSVAGSVAAGRLGDRGRGAGTGGATLLPVWTALLGAAAVVAVLDVPIVVVLVAVLLWFFASGAFGVDVQTLLLTARPDLGATASSWNSSLLYVGTAAGVSLIGLVSDLDTGVAVVGGCLAAGATLLAVPLARRVRPAPAASAEVTP